MWNVDRIYFDRERLTVLDADLSDGGVSEEQRHPVVEHGGVVVRLLQEAVVVVVHDDLLGEHDAHPVPEVALVTHLKEKRSSVD